MKNKINYLFYTLIFIISCNNYLSNDSNSIYFNSDYQNRDNERLKNMSYRDRFLYELEHNIEYDSNRFSNDIIDGKFQFEEIFLNINFNTLYIKLLSKIGFSFNNIIKVPIEYIYPSKNKSSYFLIATISNSLKSIKMMNKLGADIFKKDSRNWNAIHYSSYGGNYKVLKWLIDNKVSPNLITIEGYNSIITLFLNCKIDIIENNNNSFTFWIPYLKSFNFLMKKGVEINHLTKNNNTVLDIVIKNKGVKSYQYRFLRKYGAKRGCELLNKKCEREIE